MCPQVCILIRMANCAAAARWKDGRKPFAGGPAITPRSTPSSSAAQAVGIVGCAVGAPFAVLVAEEIFACGCRFLVSITSAGQIVPAGPPPYFVIIDRALRDEGTSYHYAPASRIQRGGSRPVAWRRRPSKEQGNRLSSGRSWTTDAPFRETADAIEAARRRGALAVEMEAAALYTFARAPRREGSLHRARDEHDGAGPGRTSRRGRRMAPRTPLQVLEAIVREFFAAARPQP